MFLQGLIIDFHRFIVNLVSFMVVSKAFIIDLIV